MNWLLAHKELVAIVLVLGAWVLLYAAIFVAAAYDHTNEDQ